MKHGTLSVETAPGLTLVGDVYGEAGRRCCCCMAAARRGIAGGARRGRWRRRVSGLCLSTSAAMATAAGRPTDATPSSTFAADSRALALEIARRFGAKPVVVGASLGGLSSLIASNMPPDTPYSALVLVDVTPRMDMRGVESVQGFMREKAEEGFATVEEAAAAIAAYLPHRPKPRSLDGLRKNLRPGPGGRLYWHWDRDFIDGPHPVGVHRGPIEAAARSRLRRSSTSRRCWCAADRANSCGRTRRRNFWRWRRDRASSMWATRATWWRATATRIFTAAVLDFLRDTLAAPAT